MSWQEIRGHDALAERFRRALASGKLASTFLFVGPAGIGKRAFAFKLAQGMLCERVPEKKLAPCGECPSCRQVLAGSHPDVLTVRKPPDKSQIPVELLIGPRERRMQEGMLHDLSCKPYSGRWKIAVIDDADYINEEDAGALLKTLEEPPPKSLLILIGTSEQRQLPTIRSRCQIVRFQPLAEQDVAELLAQAGHCDDAALARRAAALGAGSVARAALWCDESLLEFRGQLLETLAGGDWELLPAAKMLGQFVDAAGKESAAKRDRLRLAVSLAEEFYRAVLLAITAGREDANPDVRRAVQRAVRWMASDEMAAACLDVCLDTYGHIDANANQATLIEWWLDELGQTGRRGAGFQPAR